MKKSVSWIQIFALLEKQFLTLSVAMAWSVQSLPSHPATRVRFPTGSGILIPTLGLGVCPLCTVSGGGPDIVLTTHSGRPALMYLPNVPVHRAPL